MHSFRLLSVSNVVDSGGGGELGTHLFCFCDLSFFLAFDSARLFDMLTKYEHPVH